MWITAFTFDLVTATAGATCTRDPDSGLAAFCVKFRDVGNVRVNRYHDASEPCLGDMAGFLVEATTPNRARYRIDTGDAIVVFEASVERTVTISSGECVEDGDLFVKGRVEAPMQTDQWP